jgi:hypothetical protein
MIARLHILGRLTVWCCVSYIACSLWCALNFETSIYAGLHHGFRALTLPLFYFRTNESHFTEGDPAFHRVLFSILLAGVIGGLAFPSSRLGRMTFCGALLAYFAFYGLLLPAVVAR